MIGSGGAKIAPSRKRAVRKTVAPPPSRLAGLGVTEMETPPVRLATLIRVEREIRAVHSADLKSGNCDLQD
jgi:hypothetical protein